MDPVVSKLVELGCSAASKEALSQAGPPLTRFWNWVKRHTVGEKVRVAVTGMAGAGKTVLTESIKKDAVRLSAPPGQSVRLERTRRNAQGIRIEFLTLPGQSSRERSDAARAELDGKGIDGVLHFVSYGYVTVRDPQAQRALVDGGIKTLHDFRKRQLEAEQRDLELTLERLRQLDAKKRPSWLFIVPSKVDLYWDQIDAAHAYYSPEGQGAFAETLRAFHGDVGRHNITLGVLPVCSLVENFAWNMERCESKLDSRSGDELLRNFCHILDHRCG